MTNTLHFFIESGKLMVMEYVPDIANFYDRGMPILDHAIQFEQALQKAKQSAIEVDNQDEVKKAIYDADPSRNTGVETYFREGEIYSLEGCKMEVKYKKKYSYMCSDCDTENLHHNKSDQGYCCSFCGSNAKPDLSEAPKVALITFEKPRKARKIYGSTKEEPKKYPIGGYAPGSYTCTCSTCKKQFMGDKRAVQCEPCAVKMTQFEEPKKRIDSK